MARIHTNRSSFLTVKEEHISLLIPHEMNSKEFIKTKDYSNPNWAYIGRLVRHSHYADSFGVVIGNIIEIDSGYTTWLSVPVLWSKIY